ncbi:hypothetical protein AQUCO_00600093v1 [Aquilegia coerulea]|uniref:GATA transcription factor n=1 Tax=Aquilegia coerulea TaxID=218851 RepID=A0A2G5EN52_AQUCA|nr:hypothetical protein AQUCO_00600093v1 [Aquilegia coerulea]
MDCVETKALKNSFWSSSFKPITPQVFSSEDVLLCGNGTNNDDLFVEGLLDFSNNDEEDILQEKNDNFVINQYEHEEVEDEEAEEIEDDEEVKGFSSGSSSQDQDQNSNSSSQVKNEFGSVPTSELSVPTDELADLEWLSHFVEDSFSEFSLQHLVEKPEEKLSGSEPGHETPKLKPITGFLSSVPAKARSKRSRTGGRIWSLGSLLPFSESSSSSSSTSSSSSSSCLVFNNSGPGQNYELFSYLAGSKPPPTKKQKRKPMTEAQLQQRRCSHCGVQKTPQWRTGPLGAKTLCNACGVRYKSGRLLPEYRPACSPTFSSEVHSNNHRKVLEMRRKKEVILPEAELTHPVQFISENVVSY